MAGSRKKRNQQRSERQPPAKRQKRRRHDSSPNENSIDATKITDLIFDCLEKIFDRLDFEEFFNTALSNKSLQVAAVAAFKRKFGVKKTSLFPTDTNGTMAVHDDKIVICGLKSCLQFVRCFGETITDLNVLKTNSNSKSNDYLSQYIQQYCADTLCKISFDRGSIHPNSFQKPLGKVEVVEIRDYDALPRFADWFPNLRSLHFKMNYCYRKTDDRFLAVALPQLQHVTLDLSMNMNYDKLLRANLQLQSVELTCKKMLMMHSLRIIRLNGSISKLKITHRGLGVNVYVKDANRLVREHPLLAEVDLPRHHFKGNAAMILIHQLNALKMFRFAVNNQTECDEIVKQLDGTWHHDIRPANYSPFNNFTYMILELSRQNEN